MRLFYLDQIVQYCNDLAIKEKGLMKAFMEGKNENPHFDNLRYYMTTDTVDLSKMKNSLSSLHLQIDDL